MHKQNLTVGCRPCAQLKLDKEILKIFDFYLISSTHVIEVSTDLEWYRGWEIVGLFRKRFFESTRIWYKIFLMVEKSYVSPPFIFVFVSQTQTVLTHSIYIII